jgi:hypothetical protein
MTDQLHPERSVWRTPRLRVAEIAATEADLERTFEDGTGLADTPS